MSICYEDAYGNEIRSSMPAANILINVCNDAWFGDSIAPHQHLQIARMRAIENGRYFYGQQIMGYRLLLIIEEI